MAMSLGSAGEALIKSFEQLKLNAYLDQKGIPTIGWGHTGWYSEVPVAKPFPQLPVIERVHVQLGQSCTLIQADLWFNEDVLEAVHAVNHLCSFVPLTQNQFDALVSFTYNEGISALVHSTLLRKLRRGLFSEVPQEFLRWDYVDHEESEGLERRRRAEALLFSQGAPTHHAV